MPSSLSKLSRNTWWFPESEDDFERGISSFIDKPVKDSKGKVIGRVVDACRALDHVGLTVELDEIPDEIVCRIDPGLTHVHLSYSIES